MSVNKQTGFAMMEALVTALIVAIGVSGVGVLLLRSIQATQDSSQQSQAMRIVQDFVGRLRANSPAAKSSDYVGTTNLASCAAQPVPLCASYNLAGVYSEVTQDCSATELAAFDSWSTVCGLDNTVFDTPSDFIVNPILSSECIQLDARNECVQYNITLTWDIKLTKGAELAANRNNTNSFNMIVEVN
jgi:type IV pilus modification protein PilV